MRNFPVVTCHLEEGAITRADIEDPAGGIIEDAITARVAGVAKGDLVRLVGTDTNKGSIVVEKATAANEGNVVIGIVVSSPEGVDNVTATTDTPAHAQRRIASVALFGLGVIELETDATTEPGVAIELSESETGIIGDQGAVAANGGWVALSYGVDGEKVPVLVGYSGYLPAD